MGGCLILYILHNKYCIAGAEFIVIPAPDDEWSILYTHMFSLHATDAQHYSAPHMNF